MWLCPFNPKERIRIMITLNVSKKLHGLRLWNYNKSPDDTYRGVKRLHVQLNDRIISPRQGFLVRRAPGHRFFDIAQDIVFAHAKTLSENEHRKYEILSILSLPKKPGDSFLFSKTHIRNET